MNRSTTSTPPHKILKTLTVSGFAAIATIASSVAVALPASAISFNFSFTGVNGLTVNSVLTTSDPSPTATANQTYTVTGISGTVNGNAITGLGSFSPIGSPDNTFRWDGTTNIGVTGAGISFATDSIQFNLNNGASGSISDFNPGSISVLDPNFIGTSPTSLSLTPVAATPVPFEFNPSFGMLALGGAWAVRKMIQKSKSGAVNN
ncbi:MAG: hypothetical protein WCO45_16440 [Pseudanabaena sp. ELA607]|jgi:hypothetical protein